MYNLNAILEVFAFEHFKLNVFAFNPFLVRAPKSARLGTPVQSARKRPADIAFVVDLFRIVFRYGNLNQSTRSLHIKFGKYQAHRGEIEAVNGGISGKVRSLIHFINKGGS